MPGPQQAQESPFRGTTESTSLLDLLRKAVGYSPAATFGAEATGIPEVARVASGKSSAMDKVGAGMTALDLLLPMIPIAALYHGTSGLRLPGIMKKGILPRREVDTLSNVLARKGKRPAAFLTEDPNVAAQFASSKAAADAMAAAENFAQRRGLSRDQALFLRDQLERRVPGVVLELADSLRSSGVPDEMFKPEKALMYPSGVGPENITSAKSFPSDAIFDYSNIMEDAASLSSPGEIKSEGEAIVRTMQRVFDLMGIKAGETR